MEGFSFQTILVQYMKKFIIAFLLFGSCLLGQEKSRIKVLSFNIHYGIGMDKKKDLKRIARVINESGADIIGVQEVSDSVMVSELSKLTGMYGVFGASMKKNSMPNLYGLLELDEPKDLLYYGDAILSKFPFTYVGNVWIPSASESRYEAMAIDLKLGQRPCPIRLITTHFDYLNNLGSRISRMASVDVIEEKFMKNFSGASILTGDFNSTPNSEIIKLLQSKGWVLSKTKEKLLTAPSDKPSVQIDYVMPRPKDKWKIIKVEVIQEKIASDHLPVLMTLELN